MPVVMEGSPAWGIGYRYDALWGYDPYMEDYVMGIDDYVASFVKPYVKGDRYYSQHYPGGSWGVHGGIPEADLFNLLDLHTYLSTVLVAHGR
ncbi:hypothetical protein HXX76_003163 [Chlamydomonas incerta]|uniref:Uncharacterized protein n=1 Tax=Chlamydomonas incerta TaxID=51695 RepID=A0A835TD82_CHLIN|nr:hypothetical protein HXX76_003163 [Chlamydomonas incerta]|eukprot:KAG2441542.1 hypothetical protein HXX76_003163 [Chlamydomonas incerta]